MHSQLERALTISGTALMELHGSNYESLENYFALIKEDVVVNAGAERLLRNVNFAECR